MGLDILRGNGGFDRSLAHEEAVNDNTYPSMIPQEQKIQKLIRQQQHILTISAFLFSSKPKPLHPRNSQLPGNLQKALIIRLE